MAGIPPRRGIRIQGRRSGPATAALHFQPRRCTIRTLAPILPALLLLLVSCAEPGVSPGAWLTVDGTATDPAEPAPDFQLEDVNATSATFGQIVSPRDYLEKTSGWYFGHST
jgi:hypothetical protein